MENRKSIVLVTVDCLRADHVGFMGYPRPTTPFLDSLAAESLVFPAAIVAGAPTYYSFPAILASRYPLALGRDVLGLGPDEPTLATVLKKAGYKTAAFGAANPYISSRFRYETGFDTFRDFLEDEPTAVSDDNPKLGFSIESSKSWASRLNRGIQKIRPAIGALGNLYDDLYFEYCQRVTPVAGSLDLLRRFPSAEVILNHAVKWLDAVGEAPFFLWLHLMDPHAPYYPKQDAVALMEDKPITPYRARYMNSYWNRSDLGPSRLARHGDEVIALYDAGIRWVDTQMALLVESLRTTNRWDNCIFAFTADHGEEFLDHGGRYHPPSRLMEELIHVPLLLRAPGTVKKNLSTTPFSLLHLAPTVLNAAGVPVPQEFQGSSHWQQISRGEDFEGIAISECVEGCTNPFRSQDRMGPRVLSVRGRRFKLVLNFQPKAEHFYDLEADPREQAPLDLTTQRPVRRQFLELAVEHLRRSGLHRDSRVRLQARLRDLRLELKKPADKASPVAS